MMLVGSTGDMRLQGFGGNFLSIPGRWVSWVAANGTEEREPGVLVFDLMCRIGMGHMNGAFLPWSLASAFLYAVWFVRIVITYPIDW